MSARSYCRYGIAGPLILLRNAPVFSLRLDFFSELQKQDQCCILAQIFSLRRNLLAQFFRESSFTTDFIPLSSATEVTAALSVQNACLSAKRRRSKTKRWFECRAFDSSKLSHPSQSNFYHSDARAKQARSNPLFASTSQKRTVTLIVSRKTSTWSTHEPRLSLARSPTADENSS